MDREHEHEQLSDIITLLPCPRPQPSLLPLSLNNMPRETRMMMDQLAAAAMEDEASYAPSWQETFRQLKDFQKLGNAKSLPPRLIKWMDAQRRRYKLYGVGRKKTVGIIKHRIAQLNSVGFDWYQGEEKRPDHDPRPTVILPLSQRPMKSSLTYSQRTAAPPPQVEYSSQPIRRNKKKTAHRPRPRSPAGGGNIEIPMHSMDRKQLLNAGFPEQLFHMLNGASERAHHLLNWSPDGSSFEIFDTKNVGNFIRQYFRHSNLSSLRRMLHLYSFSTANNVYRHPHFYRGSSLSDIKRHVVLSQSQKNESNSIEEIVPIRCNKDTKTGHDIGAEEESSKKVMSNSVFPEQLFNMVNDGSKTHPHLLNWSPEGDAFEILDTKNVGNFIRHYFRHGKVSSLRRMLHLYQFQTSNNVFRHPNFHRDRSLSDIKRYVVKKA
ncbi:heat shock factor family protein [Skeletonema marinoi]|uniref:Heat shock factor family protein n=1 Tax=Skeletonema marinoi TaxID=267567 RepID=A0AAD8Y2V3_9STRA|nr:heat shock factor family protein [Skeletonema marinoi]